MNIISQPCLFDYMNIEVLGDLNSLLLVYQNLDISRLVIELNNIRKNGRNDYPNDVMIKLIIASVVYSHSTIASFRRELSRNSQLRLACGLKDWEYEQGLRKSLIPAARVFSEFFNRLIPFQHLIDELCMDAVKYLYENVQGFGNTIAGDGKYIQTYANKTVGDINDRRTESDATYSVKQKFYKDFKTGETKVKKAIYYGFRVHVIVDALTELPITWEVSPANVSEQSIMEKLIENVSGAKYLTLDRGYDSGPLLEIIRGKGIIPVVDKRIMKAGQDSVQYLNTNIYYDDYANVTYYDEELEEFKPMKFLGHEKKRKCVCYEYKGKKYRIKIKENPRVFNEVARTTQRFKKIYNTRTSVERYNSRIDRDYGLEMHCIRGLKKMSLMMSLINLVMLTFGKAHDKDNKKHYASKYQFTN